MDNTSLFSVQVVAKQGIASRDIEHIRQQFSDYGFVTGPIVGGNFSVTASAQKFVELFETGTSGARDASDSSSRIDYWLAKNQSRDTLPIDSLPQELQTNVFALIIGHDPAFGPTDFSM